MIENKTGIQDGSPRRGGGAVLLRAGALVCALMLVIIALAYRRQVEHRTPVDGTGAENSVPAYYRTPPTGPLPATIPAKQFDDPGARQAYLAAAKIKSVLYQLPCYCHCDRAEGHKSLLDCFRSYHGASCLTCRREAVFAYQQFQNGKTVAEIRQAIIRGDWRIPSK